MRKLILLIIIGFAFTSCSKKTQPSAEIAPKQEEVSPPDAPIDDAVLEIVEEVPSYPGGEEERVKFISKNINYPRKARKEGVQGSVYVQFVVEKDGSLSNIKIAKSIGYGCDEEVIRVIKLMPKWNPGKQKGKPVRVRVAMPIKFTLK